MKNKTIKTLGIFMAVTLIAVVALTGCGKSDESPNSTSSASADMADTGETLNIGEGETVFMLDVTDNSGTVTNFAVSTNEKTVGAALLENGLIEGEESDFGLFIKSVNGLKADYNTDKAYWAFYIDGEYALTGADTTNIESGKTYAFIYTKE